MNVPSAMVRELVDLLSSAILMLHKDRHIGLVDVILGRMERLAISDDPDSVFLRLRVIDHRCDISFADGRFSDAEKCCKEGMAIAGPDHPQYYSFGAWLARTRMERGDCVEALEMIGDFVLRAIEHKIAKPPISDLFRVATRSDPGLSAYPEKFVDALQEFGLRHCNVTREECTARWRSSPRQTLDYLLASSATGT